jgi:hypothetical protein
MHVPFSSKHLLPCNSGLRPQAASDQSATPLHLCIQTLHVKHSRKNTGNKRCRSNIKCSSQIIQLTVPLADSPQLCHVLGDLHCFNLWQEFSRNYSPAKHKMKWSILRGCWECGRSLVYWGSFYLLLKELTLNKVAQLEEIRCDSRSMSFIGHCLKENLAKHDFSLQQDCACDGQQFFQRV